MPIDASDAASEPVYASWLGGFSSIGGGFTGAGDGKSTNFPGGAGRR